MKYLTLTLILLIPRSSTPEHIAPIIQTAQSVSVAVSHSIVAARNTHDIYERFEAPGYVSQKLKELSQAKINAQLRDRAGIFMTTIDAVSVNGKNGVDILNSKRKFVS